MNRDRPCSLCVPWWRSGRAQGPVHAQLCMGYGWVGGQRCSEHPTPSTPPPPPPPNSTHLRKSRRGNAASGCGLKGVHDASVAELGGWATRVPFRPAPGSDSHVLGRGAEGRGCARLRTPVRCPRTPGPHSPAAFPFSSSSPDSLRHFPRPPLAAGGDELRLPAVLGVRGVSGFCLAACVTPSRSEAGGSVPPPAPSPRGESPVGTAGFCPSVQRCPGIPVMSFARPLGPAKCWEHREHRAPTPETWHPAPAQLSPGGA